MFIQKHRGKATALVAPILLMFSLAALAAPKAEFWERWTAHDANSTASIDHSAWHNIVQKYVIASGSGGLNRFRYGSVSNQDKAALKGYIKALAATPISKHNRNEQRAYWINLYNAATIDVVLDHYPVDSILDIKLSSGFLTKGPWKKKILKVEGEDISLDDIEHRILRPIWKDPRLHYTVNCASVGCPNLMNTAFTADNYEKLADAGARDFINDPRGAKVDDGDLEVSSIYVWFQSDFGGNDAGVIRHLKQYANKSLSAKLASVDEIDDDDYNWSLNEAK